VLAAVEKLGLSGYANASYTRGLRCLLGLAPARYAVVDIGTNSVKFHIGEQRSDGSWWRVVDRAEVTRIGEGLQEHGDIGPEPLERTLHAVEEMAAEAGENDVLAVAAVGTAALRIASNAAAVIQAMNERTGLSVQVVSGEEESRLAYLAARAGVGLAEGSVVVFDTGGGSSQFTFGRGSEVEERYSLNVGAVSYTERFGLQGAVDEETITQARRALNDDLARLTERPSPDALVGMGGAVTNLAAVSLSLDPYDPDIVQGTVLSSEEIQRQIAMYRSMGAGERASVVGLQPNRALVMLAGALIVAAVLGRLGKETLVVSDRGLRHGLIRERFGLFPPAAS
jgi:exopolyphosphatase/guanosine-5'-triphosphate,3'-diphosphate pyrophosphatase